MSEVLQAIKLTKRASAPGLDWFFVLYYQKCANTLVPHLKKCFSALWAAHTLHSDMNSAFPKPGKDPGEVVNYSVNDEVEGLFLQIIIALLIKKKTIDI